MTATSAPAGFWHRYAAWSLDAAILFAAALLLAWPRLQLAWQTLGAAAKGLVASAGQALADTLMAGTRLPQLPAALLQDERLYAAASAVQSATWQLLWPLLLGYAVLAAPWHVIGELSRWRGSAGKRAMGLAATDLHGRTLSLPRATLRHVAGLLSWLTFNLGHLMAGLPPPKRALHDYVAGARVVRTGASTRLPGWARAWIGLQVLVSFALLCWLMLRYVAALQASFPVYL